VENICDQRLRNGSWTLNKYRAEIGEPLIDGGDDAVLVDRQNLVLWSDMADLSKANIAAKAGKAAAPAAGEPGDQLPDGGEPAQGDQPSGNQPPAGGEPAGKASNEPPAESVLRRGQQAIYRKRLALAMRLMRAVTESDEATA
jgi:hypothetical protein